MSTRTKTAAPIYEAEVRPNGRGGWEVGVPGDPAGQGFGNYPDKETMMGIARMTWPAEQITVREPKPSKV